MSYQWEWKEYATDHDLWMSTFCLSTVTLDFVLVQVFQSLLLWSLLSSQFSNFAGGSDFCVKVGVWRFMLVFPQVHNNECMSFHQPAISNSTFCVQLFHVHWVIHAKTILVVWTVKRRTLLTTSTAGKWVLCFKVLTYISRCREIIYCTVHSWKMCTYVIKFCMCLLVLHRRGHVQSNKQNWRTE